MRLPMKPRHVAPRVTTGAFILDSGLSKRNADAETAGGIHGMAAGAYPFLASVDPQQFVRTLSRVEMALGGALLAPFVPTGLAAAGLTAFAGGLVGLYLRTPSLHREGSLLPSKAGTGIAKDVWMLGIGIGSLVDAWRHRDD